MGKIMIGTPSDQVFKKKPTLEDFIKNGKAIAEKRKAEQNQHQDNGSQEKSTNVFKKKPTLEDFIKNSKKIAEKK